MGRLREFIAEWKARRAGRKFLDHGIRTTARGIIGPTGWLRSNAWDHVDEDGEAFLESFDRRIPPSEFVSKRDRTRHNIPVPLAERAIGDDGRTRMNHYLILGVEPTATQEEIEAAFLRVSRQNMAPFGPGGGKTSSIEEAYIILRNPKLRAQYDRTLL